MTFSRPPHRRRRPSRSSHLPAAILLGHDWPHLGKGDGDIAQLAFDALPILLRQAVGQYLEARTAFASQGNPQADHAGLLHDPRLVALQLLPQTLLIPWHGGQISERRHFGQETCLAQAPDPVGQLQNRRIPIAAITAAMGLAKVTPPPPANSRPAGCRLPAVTMSEPESPPWLKSVPTPRIWI